MTDGINPAEYEYGPTAESENVALSSEGAELFDMLHLTVVEQN